MTGLGREGQGKGPRTVFALPLYNHADKLAETLDSLLAQTDPDFALILTDDGSSDETAALAAAFAARDRRVCFFQNATRLGYIGNARKGFELARRLFPGAEFFAWGSDHDVWHPAWLATLGEALRRDPGAVIAYPRSLRIDAAGAVVSQNRVSYRSPIHAATGRRLLSAVWGISAGNMVYGLIRAEALARSGVLRGVYMPDRLLLAELALRGRLVLVDETLWSRRYAGIATKARQLRASFPAGPPWHTKLPWWLAHGGVLAKHLALAPPADAPVGRIAGLGLAMAAVVVGGAVVVRNVTKRSLYRSLRRLRGRAKPTGIAGPKGVAGPKGPASPGESGAERPASARSDSE